MSGGGMRAIPWMGRKPARVAPEDAAIAGAAAQPLTSKQRQKLAALSARAFAFQRKLGMWDGDADGFRHAAVFDLCQKGGVSELCQREYGPACRMFLKLAGAEVRDDRAPRSRAGWSAAKAPARDDADRARHKLLDETFAAAAAFGGQPGAQAYAEQLLARIHRADLATATARQLWQVFFTLRNRARAKSRQNAQDAPEAASATETAETPSGAFAGFRGRSAGKFRGDRAATNAPMRPDGREGG